MYFSHAKEGVVRAGKAVNLGLGVEFPSGRRAGQPRREVKLIFSQGGLQFTRSVDGGRPPASAASREASPF